jgi:excisionase family DNA binding protein
VAQRSNLPLREKEVLSMSEACQYLGLNRITLLKLIREGKVPASKLRFCWRMRKADLDYFVRHGKNPVAVEEEKEKAREASEKPEKKAPAPKREVLDPEAFERLKSSSRPRRQLSTALLLRNAIAILSENPCYLVGPESQTFMNTHLRDDGLECDFMAQGALCGVLSRSAELLLLEELPPPSHRRQLLTLPVQFQSIEVAKEHLNRAIQEVGLSEDDGYRLKSCAGELMTNAVEAGGRELRVIIEVGREDILFTVINQGRVEDLPGRMPGPESRRGRGIELTKRDADDFLFLSTNDQVIATVRKARKSST